jgi:predicted CxxxxCH...CXXCH cytochrome family protein
VIRDFAIVSPARRAALLTVAVCSLAIARPAAAQVCDPATSGVGAHLVHARDNPSRLSLACTECHAPACSPAQASNVVFGSLASAHGAQPAWDPATKTCSGVYCHGATLGFPPGPIAWTYVDPAVAQPPSQLCSVCHGYPPANHSPGSTACNGCHPLTVLADGSIDLAGGHHVDGTLDVAGGGGGTGCGGCHGFPPGDAAHLAHFGLPDAAATGSYGDLTILQDRYPTATPADAPAAYAFGCGLCHPLDPAKHRDGTVEVEVYDASAPAASLKGRAASTAAYDPATKTCSGVYCHSTGQQDPVFATSPGWSSGAVVGCDGCHGNPPAYPSGGAGASTANSHLNLADDGYEFGHFLGMPGAWHTSKHGGNWSATEDAAPITCQSCHYDTTDPANTGPSGFYYLDTTGSYALPGGDPGRISWGWQASIQCGYCHDAGGAATGTGKVLPLRHVNGTRDVVFDPRAALPSIPWLPAAPNTPAGPYWITNPGLQGYWPSFVTWTGTTLSFDLGVSGYDPATKTCTNVACHVAEQQPVWGTPYRYYTEQSATCYTCHPM